MVGMGMRMSLTIHCFLQTSQDVGGCRLYPCNDVSVQWSLLQTCMERVDQQDVRPKVKIKRNFYT